MGAQNAVENGIFPTGATASQSTFADVPGSRDCRDLCSVFFVFREESESLDAINVKLEHTTSFPGGHRTKDYLYEDGRVQ